MFAPVASKLALPAGVRALGPKTLWHTMQVMLSGTTSSAPSRHHKAVVWAVSQCATSWSRRVSMSAAASELRFEVPFLEVLHCPNPWPSSGSAIFGATVSNCGCEGRVEAPNQKPRVVSDSSP